MAFGIASDDMNRLESALQTLLSPLEYTSLSSWQKAALAAVHETVDAHHSAFWMPDESEDLSVVGNDLGATLLQLLADVQARVFAGRRADVLMKKASRARLRRGSGVHHERDISDRETVERSPIYQDVFRPAGVRYTTGMSMVFPQTEGGVVLAFETDEAAGYDEPGLTRLRLLHPAFVAGCRIAYRFAHQTEALERMLDSLHEPALILSKNGTVLHINHALTRLVEAESDAEKLTSAVQAYAELVRAHRFAADSKSRTPAVARIASSSELTTNSGHYRFSGSYIESLGIGTAAVIVSVQFSGYSPLSPTYLQERYGLTPRQAEVTMLLTKSLTNREIAEVLSVSPHTVKHHVSHIMEKLGVGSRTEIVAHLLRR